MKMLYVGSLNNSPDRDFGWITAFELKGVDVSKYCVPKLLEISMTSGVFTIQFPANTSTAAILRISG